MKEPWQLTKKEVEEIVSDISEYVQRTPKGQYPDRRLYKKLKEYSLSLDEYYDLSGGKHQKLVQQAVSEGKSIPVEILKDYPELMPPTKPPTKVKYVKEVWQMTKREFVERARRWEDLSPEQQQMAQEDYIKQTGDEEGARLLKVMSNWFYDKHTGRVLGEDIESHDWYIKQAIVEGKPVPPAVLADYPDLIARKAPKQLSKPLPPDAQNVQTVPFDSQLFACYGKQTKQGFRAYCRRK